jgi:CHASE3 domain sensor protein
MTPTTASPPAPASASPAVPSRRVPTPRLYRLWSGVVLGGLIAMAVGGAAFAVGARAATNRLSHNTGPVLVATQTLVASLGEAEAAATAAFVSGRPEDRDQRNDYLDSIARADQQLEQIAALVGNDPTAHSVIQSLAVSVTRFAALIEAARAENLDGVKGAASSLVAAVDLLAATVSGDAAHLTAIAEQRFASQTHARSRWAGLAVALAVVALAALLVGQVHVAVRARRVFNPGLLAASFLVIGVLVWLTTADARVGDDLATSRRAGYDAIALTARIQTSGFASKSDDTLAVITGDRTKASAADGEAATVSQLLAQARSGTVSARAQAAVVETQVRWARYRAGVTAARASTAAASQSLSVGGLSSTFDGFNVSVESMLGDSRSVFTAALARAGDRLNGLQPVILIGLAAAAVLALAGYQVRIDEYR